MHRFQPPMNPRARLLFYVQELERLEAIKKMASDTLKEAFQRAKGEGYDTVTLKVVLKLRKMTPEQRRERRALEAIYMAELGMLDGDSLPDEARRRLDPPADPEQGADPSDQPEGHDKAEEPPQTKEPEQPPLIVKDPAEAREEGVDAAAAGKRIYDNPYRAGDPCRAAWDEGWCAGRKSHGMDTPEAYQRRTSKPAKSEKTDKDDKDEKGDKDPGPSDTSEEARR